MTDQIRWTVVSRKYLYPVGNAIGKLKMVKNYTVVCYPAGFFPFFNNIVVVIIVVILLWIKNIKVNDCADKIVDIKS